MKDYSEGVEVEVLPAGPRWSVACPECKAPVSAATKTGTIEALCAHMNAHHYQPPRGNA